MTIASKKITQLYNNLIAYMAILRLRFSNRTYTHAHMQSICGYIYTFGLHKIKCIIRKYKVEHVVRNFGYFIINQNVMVSFTLYVCDYYLHHHHKQSFQLTT